MREMIFVFLYLKMSLRRERSRLKCKNNGIRVVHICSILHSILVIKGALKVGTNEKVGGFRR
jgi:hypothetical protein